MNKDSWETPAWLFEELNKEFNFDIDLCAAEENAKCSLWCEDYLYLYLLPSFCNRRKVDQAFMNPPYSNPYPFVEKAWKDSLHFKIVCVLPAKTDTKWWRIFWDSELHKPKEGCEVRFMPYKAHHKSRVAFINPETGKEQSGNPCGTAIVIFDRRSINE